MAKTPPRKTLKDYFTGKSGEEPRVGPTVEAWKQLIPQDLEEINPRPSVMPSQAELEESALDALVPMGSVAGAVRNVGAKAAKPAVEAAKDALIRTWHASKSDVPFPKFLREYFGKGAGGDRMGRGVYSTTAREESEEYLKNVAQEKPAEVLLEGGQRFPIPYEIATQLRNKELPLEGIVSNAEKKLLSLEDIAQRRKSRWAEGSARQQSDLLNTLRSVLAGKVQEVKRPGTLYELGLDVSPEQLLHFDKELIDQTPFVQDAIKSAMGINPNPRSPKDVVAFRNMLNQGIKTPEVTKRLEEAGIQGVLGRPSSSMPGSKTMNYATFDPDRVSILRNLGILGMLTGAGAAGKGSQPNTRKKPQGG